MYSILRSILSNNQPSDSIVVAMDCTVFKVGSNYSNNSQSVRWPVHPNLRQLRTISIPIPLKHLISVKVGRIVDIYLIFDGRLGTAIAPYPHVPNQYGMGYPYVQPIGVS